VSTSRSQRARALARRVEHQDRPVPASAQWSALAAVWLHLATLVGLRLASPGEVALGPDERYLEVIRTTAASEGTRRADGPREPGRPLVSDEDPERSAAYPADGATEQPSRDPEDEPPPRRVVRSEDANAEQAPDIDTVSAHDVASDTETSAPVTSDREGLPTPISDGAADLAGSPTLERREGDIDAAQGNRADGEPGPVVLGGGGGGATAAETARGAGAPQLGEGLADGSASPSSAPGATERSLAARGASSPLAVTAPVGPLPTRPVGAAAPGWWQPLAVRTAPNPTSSPAGVPDPQEVAVEPRPAPTPRRGRSGISGGAKVAELEVSSEAPVAAPAADTRGVRQIAAVGTADPVAELREALGFGPLDRATLAPRPTWAGLLRQEGAQDSSPQAAFDAPIAWRTAFSARGTVEGAYIQRVSEQIQARWQGSDLDLHSRASGVQGEVTVRYEIRRDGQTSWVRVVRSSGNRALDDLARAAIPNRLDRFPPDLRQHVVRHEITFRYRNPLVGP
jgi:TonB family protein